MVVIFSFSVSGLVTQIRSQCENKVELYFEKNLNLLIYVRLHFAAQERTLWRNPQTSNSLLTRITVCCVSEWREKSLFLENESI